MKDAPLREKIYYPTVRELIEGVSERFSDRVAYTYRENPRKDEKCEVTYPQLRDDIRALTTALIAKGIKGKHCVVIGRISYDWVRLYFSILSAGGVLVPLDPDWSAEDLADTAMRSNMDFLFCDTEQEAKTSLILSTAGVTEAPVYLGDSCENSIAKLAEAGAAKLAEGDRSYFENEIDPDKLALLVFTSGTTGKGKGVMLSQTNILVDMAEVVPYIDFSVKCMAVLPPHHTYGSTVALLGQTSIGCNVYISAGIKYILREINDHKPGHLVVVPLYVETFHRRIVAGIKDSGKEKLVKIMMKVSNGLRKVGIDLRRKLFKSILDKFGGEINMLITGGAPINQEIIDTFDAIGITVLNGYGITECAPLISVNHNRFINKGSVGPALPVDTIKIDDPNEDGEGEILVKGPNVMLGYYNNEEATRDAFDEEGYFRTGDYGKIDKNNVIYITGRKKNLIILSNGKNVYPEEIESELSAVPGVLDIIVYEGKSKRGMEHNAIVAEIYPDKEFLERNEIADKQQYFQEYVDKYNRTAVPYKKVAVLRVRDEEFPKNTLRKILRFKLDMTID